MMEYINSDFEEQWFTYPGVYRLMVSKCRPNGMIVELGAWKGRSSPPIVTGKPFHHIGLSREFAAIQKQKINLPGK